MEEKKLTINEIIEKITEEDVRKEMLSQWMSVKKKAMTNCVTAMDNMLSAIRLNDITMMIHCFNEMHKAHITIEEANSYIMYNAAKLGYDLNQFLPSRKEKDQ